MHVLFLEIDQERDWAVASIGPAFIAAVLRKHGHSSSFLRVGCNMPSSHVVERIRQACPDLLAVSLTARQWLRARDVVRDIRKQVAAPVIAGGLYPSFSPQRVLKAPGIDYVCIGEGELALLELANAFDQHNAFPEKGIRNIWHKRGPKPELRDPFSPIDDLPFMARDHLDEKYGVIHMITQRGCPFSCTYCAARQFNDLYPGGYKRFGRRRSPENVLAELHEIQTNGSLNYVIFLDDTFTINHPWLERFCTLYKEQFRIPFSVHARVETVRERLLHQLWEAGCRHIAYGVESGSERVRRDIMKRCASNRQFIDVFRWTREVGIMATANYIIATPGETRADIEATLDLHEQIKPTDFGYFVFYPFEGTALFRLCQEKGYLPENYHELSVNHSASILNLPDLTPEDIDMYYQRFTQIRVRGRAAFGTESGFLSARTELNLQER